MNPHRPFGAQKRRFHAQAALCELVQYQEPVVAYDVEDSQRYDAVAQWRETVYAELTQSSELSKALN